MKYLFKHAHLVIDDKNEFIDGAILVEKNKIIDLYPHSNKIKNNYEDVKEIDINGNIIMTALFEGHFDDTKDLSGVGSFVYDIPNMIDIDKQKYEDDYRYLGLYLDKCFVLPKYSEIKKDFNIEIINTILSYKKIKAITLSPDLPLSIDIAKIANENNVRVLIGKTDSNTADFDFHYDGIRNLFHDMPMFNYKDANISTLAFMNNTYVELNQDIEDNLFRLCLNNIERDKILLVSNKTMASTIKRLKEMKINNCDILSMCCLNYYRFYDLDKLYGTLRKGKYANVIILDNEMDIIGTYLNGELDYE